MVSAIGRFFELGAGDKLIGEPILLPRLAFEQEEEHDHEALKVAAGLDSKVPRAFRDFNKGQFLLRRRRVLQEPVEV
jgi:hypothetical protein